MKVRNFGLRGKIISPLLVTFLVSVAILAIIFATTFHKLAKRQFIENGKLISKTLAANIQATLLNNDASTVQSFIDEYKNAMMVTYVFIENEKQEITAHTIAPTFPVELVELTSSGSLVSNVNIKDVDFGGQRQMDFAAPILAGYLGKVHVGLNIQALEEELYKYFWFSFLCSVVVSAIGLTLVLFVLGRSIGKIISLSRITQAIAESKDLRQPIPQYSEDEIGILANSFAKMVKELLYQQEHLELLVETRTELLKSSLDQVETAKEQLVHSSKLAALGEMTGAMAHEINTPLSAILLLASQLEEKEVSTDSEYVQKVGEKIKKMTDRVAKIIKGLKIYSRDGQTDSFEKSKLSEIIDDTLALCSERFRQKGVLFELASFDQSLQLDCRPVQISQILLNLLNNSYDVICEQELRWIRMNVSCDNYFAYIKVLDSGHRIPDHIKIRLFQSFFTTKSFGKGTGLGLSVSRKIAQQHQGDLYIDESEVNTCFVLKVPLNAGETKNLAS